jgi:hypothetical protein
MTLNLTEHQNAKLAENELVRASLDDKGLEKSFDPDLMTYVEDDGDDSDSLSFKSYDPEELCFSDEDEAQDLAGFAVTDA